MVEKTQEELIKIYEPVMTSIINAMYYRVLGATSIHDKIENILDFAQAEADGYGKFGGELERNKWPIWFIPAKSIGEIAISGNYWKNVNVSEPDTPEEYKLTTNIYVWGFKKLREGALVFSGENVIFTREYWWGLYILRAKLKNALG